MWIMSCTRVTLSCPSVRRYLECSRHGRPPLQAREPQGERRLDRSGGIYVYEARLFLDGATRSVPFGQLSHPVAQEPAACARLDDSLCYLQSPLVPHPARLLRPNTVSVQFLYPTCLDQNKSTSLILIILRADRRGQSPARNTPGLRLTLDRLKTGQVWRKQRQQKTGSC